MAKKRGGLAGLYDRNKKIFQTAAPILAGAFGGPMAGAAVGAAMRGLDRPGKSGIGLDPFEAVKGGVAGYGMGKLGQAGRQGITSLFTAKAAPNSALFQSGTEAMDKGLAMVPDVTAPNASSSASSLFTPSMPDLSPLNVKDITGITSLDGKTPGDKKSDGKTPGDKKRISSLLTGLRENWEPIAGIAKGVGSTMSGQAQESLANEKIALERLRFEEERAQLQRERESRQRLTQLLIPLLQSQMTNVLPPNVTVPR
jgi:hypothetical protein